MWFPRTLAALAHFQAESAAYVAVNRVTSMRRGRSLLTPADAAVPFEPSSLWLYLSFVPFCLSAVYEGKSARSAIRMMACLMLSSLVCYRSFLRFPSPYPRPPVDVADPRLARAWRALRSADGPGNTFPSIHVGHVFLIALVLSQRLPDDDADARLLWALLVSLSTLTTKQHFVVDVAGGILVAETVARHVFEPWEDGRLSVRAAWREMRRLCDRLDAAARDPASLRLQTHDLHPRLLRLLESADRDRSLASVCARAPGRHGLIERERHLAAQLRGSRVAVATLVASAPEWLQFLRLVEDADGGLTEDGVIEHLDRLDGGLVAALRAVFDDTASAADQPTRLQSMLPASGATT